MIDGMSAAVAVLVVALVLDAALGDMPWLFRRVPHPVALLGRAIGFLDHRLNRRERPPAERRRRGALTLVLVVGLAVMTGRIVEVLGPWAEAAAVFLLLAQRSLHDHVRAVASGLEADLSSARSAVAGIVGRDPEALDGPGVARAAIESLAENFSDGVVAPVFWFLLLGVPGLAACKAINTLDSMIGHRTERHRAFGAWSARADDIMNFLPARLAALIIMLAALPFPRASARGAWKAALADAHGHRSVNAGWPEAAMAGALGLALAGPRRYGAEWIGDAWMGKGGRRQATAADIRRALKLFAAACGLHAAAAVGLLAIIG